MRCLNLLLTISLISAFESPVYRQEEWNVYDTHVQPQTQFYEGIFPTRVDHFQPDNQNTTRFVYHVNANYFVSRGPIYIYLKDPSDISTYWIEHGLMVDIAKETGAALLTFDMRFFGQNRITSDASFENLELLTIDQTIADIATFIIFIREYVGNSEYSKVILWGSGYGGSLSVWTRKRYPQLVTGSWASSGFFSLSVYSFIPFDRLELTLRQSFTFADCRDRVHDAYRILNELFENGEGEYISNRFNLCHPVDTDSQDDIAAFYELSIRALINFFDQHHMAGVNNFCFNMRAIMGDTLNSFARWIVHVYGNGSCFDHSFTGLIERNSISEWNQYGTNTGRRQLYYLQCTQLGGFPVADQFTWIPQDVPLEYHIKICEEIFGSQYNSSTLSTTLHNLNVEFGESISNVIYTNGNLDPWRFFGRLFDEMGVSINIDYQSRSGDLTSLSVNDPQSLYYAKREIRSLIEEWSRRDTTNLTASSKI